MAKAPWPVRNPPEATAWLRQARQGENAQPSAVSHLSHRRGKGTGAPGLGPSPTGTTWTKQHHDKNERLRR